jgi:hypothetical protein
VQLDGTLRALQSLATRRRRFRQVRQRLRPLLPL